MKKTLVALAILSTSVSFAADAAFRSNNWTDDMTDTKVFSEYTSVKSSGHNNYQQFGWECRLRDGSDSAKTIELMYDGDEAIATPNSITDVQLRVDKGKVYKLKGRNYSNSYRGGLIHNVPSELFSELKSGSKLHVKIGNLGSVDVMETFSLSGSTASLNKMVKNCGLSIGESADVVAAKKAINDKYDVMIADLEKQRAKELKAIK
ncbi:hypothetical protein HGP28_13665 [Vibrio sp. SM6]|uniref:Uncharacterized protein n=1 Tax=Vibrio agarilyticus TaxID=2726741 RepID=A0A7X8TST6_9VIBR|nr:hypothetical protein [Vibrio agarilyticus]NLS13937.1 hypothetical protein [Vibrio agarilyticus]